MAINPTFMLRGVSPPETLTKYLRGEFSSAPLPSVKVVRLPFEVKKNENIESYTDRSNSKTEVLRSGPGKVCLWHRAKIQGDGVYLPTGETESGTLLSCLAFCSYECAEAFVDYSLSLPMSRQEPALYEARKRLHRMFLLSHPGEVLQKAPDWTQHQESGGPLDDAKFFAKRHTYISIPSIDLRPTSQTFSVQ